MTSTEEKETRKKKQKEKKMFSPAKKSFNTLCKYLRIYDIVYYHLKMNAVSFDELSFFKILMSN